MSYQLGQRKKRRPLIILGLLVIIIGGGVAGWLHWHQPTKKMPVHRPVVPTSIANAVNFPIYYPDPSQLPPGYSLDSSSFSKPVKNGVAFWVSYGQGQRVVFSDQAKPSDSELKSFVANYIPLNIDYQTASGPAKIGAYNNHGTVETLVSLPTNSSTWLVITAPASLNQTDLKQILRAIRH